MNTRKIVQSLSAVAIAMTCAFGAFANENTPYPFEESNQPAAQGPVGVRVLSESFKSEDDYYINQSSSLPASQVKVGAYRSDNAPFGIDAQGVQADRMVRINAAVKSLNVNRGEVVTIASGEKAFTWKFETLGRPTFELAKIAPQDFGAGKVLVYVNDMADSD